MEESAARKELSEFLLQQKQHGCLRRTLCLVLFNRGYSEQSVGLALGINPKTAHAAKIDMSKAGKDKREKSGKRVHLDSSTAQLKRINDKKMLTKYLELVDKVLAESAQKEKGNE